MITKLHSALVSRSHTYKISVVYVPGAIKLVKVKYNTIGA